jgi:TRAP-type mannitol/chloroaromatic compound transport system substrate-binding protein
VTTERRRFIATASGVVASGAAALVHAPRAIAQPKVQWRMTTTWTPSLDILQGAAQRLGQIVEEMSGGRFRIEVFPGGQIMPPFECFDAASQGKVEAFMASPQYWNEREPAVEWFGTIPFGMNPEGITAWFYQGDGLKLWEEAYAPFNLVPRPAFTNGPQMGGWFRRKINAPSDFKGLRMRIPNLGGKVITRAGGTTVLTPGGEIYAALERGVIDAAEFVAPHEDMKLGLHKTARYYYYPGWHEPGTMQEFVFNKKAYEALPVDLRRMLDHAAAAVQVYAHAEFHMKNAIASVLRAILEDRR